MAERVRNPRSRLARRPSGRGDRGFVLVAVLWVTALLSLYAIEFQSTTMEFVRTTRNAVETAKAEFAADAGVRLAVLELIRGVAPATSAAAAPVTNAFSCQMPDGSVIRVVVEAEAGKVNINQASDELLKALLAGAGLDDQAAAKLSDAIADYRDPDNERRAQGAELAEYLAAGRAEGPKNAPFDSVEELADVLGVSDELFRSLRPYLTVHSGRGGIDARNAPPELVTMLSGDRATGIAASSIRPAPEVPPRFLSATGTDAYTIWSEGRTAGGTASISAVIVSKQSGVAQLDGLLKTAAQSGGSISRLRQLTGTQTPPPDNSTLIRVWLWEHGVSGAPLIKFEADLLPGEC